MRIKTVEYKKIPIDQIDIREDYVRTRVREVKRLGDSIDSLGLIQPIVVFPKDDRYVLVVGRRRLRALQERGQRSVEARVIEPIDDIIARVVSVVENEQRRSLPFRDTVMACDHLFEKYDSVEEVAKALHISVETAVKYLRFRLAPEEVLRMVEEGKITQGDAEKATIAGYPNKEKIIRVAQAIADRRLTKEQTRRLPDIAKEHPEASADELIQQSKKRPIRLIIPVPISLLEALERAAKDYVMDRKDVAKMALSSWLTNMGYLVD